MECCVQLNQLDNPDRSGPHWYCDALASDFRNRTIFLCEISYSKSLSELLKRLAKWNFHWPLIRPALARDSFLPVDWPARPWLFVPEKRVPRLVTWLRRLADENTLAYEPRITPLEMVQPWQYCSWNRVGEGAKPEIIPVEMRN
jgi:hypothetical protein